MTNPTILALLDTTKDFMIECDTYGNGVGAILIIGVETFGFPLSNLKI